MKDIVLAIITRLKADATVAAQVGTRIYRKKLPLNPVFPAITVSRVDKIRDKQKNNTGRYADARVQCTIWANSDGYASDISDMVTDSLNLVSNTVLSTGDTSGVYVVYIEDAGGVPDEDTVLSMYMDHRDFMVKYSYR
ncbi:MAG: DUF3168 domain-containing protein [Deltaproteobacteria bacterium]|nr:DUF3168 domain-containing protein [Deltaproteobacteria bacterium]